MAAPSSYGHAPAPARLSPGPMSSQALLRVTIWLATLVCVAMLFIPLVGTLLTRLGVALDTGPP